MKLAQESPNKGVVSQAPIVNLTKSAFDPNKPEQDLVNQIQQKNDPIYIKQGQTRFQYSLKYIQDMMMSIGLDFETDKAKYGWFLRQILITELPSYWRIESIMDETNSPAQSQMNNSKQQVFDFQPSAKLQQYDPTLLSPSTLTERDGGSKGRRNSTFTKSDSVNLNKLGLPSAPSHQLTLTLGNQLTANIGGTTSNLDKQAETKGSFIQPPPPIANTPSRRGSRRSSKAAVVVYYNMLTKQVSTLHPLIPLFRRTFNRLIKLSKLRDEKIGEEKVSTILTEEEQKHQKIRKWQEQKMKQESELDMNLIGTRLRLKNLRQADKEKIVEGSSRFKDVMLSMYDIKDKERYVNERGDSLYPIFDLNTKSKRKLIHIEEEVKRIQSLSQDLSQEQTLRIYQRNHAYYNSILNKQLLEKMMRDEDGVLTMEKVNLREIIENAQYYGVNLLKESHLVWIGHLPNILGLPPGWVKQVDYEKNQEKYVHLQEEIELSNHPADLYIYSLIDGLRDYYKQNFNALRTGAFENSPLNLKSYDGLLRNYEANLTTATKQYQEYLKQQAVILKQQQLLNKKRQYGLKNKTKLNVSPSTLDVAKTAGAADGIALEGEDKEQGNQSHMDAMNEHRMFQSYFEDMEDVQREKEQQFNSQLGLSDIYVVTDYEIFEVARQCEIDMEKDLNLLLALENLIIDYHHQFVSTSDWQFRVAHDPHLPSSSPLKKGLYSSSNSSLSSGLVGFRCWWVNLKTNQTTSKYPYLDRIKLQLLDIRQQTSRLLNYKKSQIKNAEEVSNLFTGIKGETIKGKVLEQRQRVTEMIIQQRLRLFNQVQKRKMAGVGIGIFGDQYSPNSKNTQGQREEHEIGQLSNSASPSKLGLSKRNTLLLEADSEDSQENIDPYDDHSPLKKGQRKVQATSHNASQSSLNLQILPQEYVDFTELVRTYLQSNMTPEELKDLIFFCPFRLYKDYLRQRIPQPKDRKNSQGSGSKDRIEEHNDEDLESSFMSVDSEELDSEAMSNRLRDRKRHKQGYQLAQREDNEESDISNYEVGPDGIRIEVLKDGSRGSSARRRAHVLKDNDGSLLGVKGKILSKDEKVEKQIMGLFSSVGRRPSNRSRVSKPEIEEQQSQQLFAPTPQQQQFLLVPPMRRMQTITKQKSNQDYSQAIKLVNINELDEIIKRVNLNNDDFDDSHLKQHEEDGNNFRRSDWPPGAIPSNPLSSNPSNPQSQLSQNVVPGFQRGRTLMMRTAVSDINVNSDFKETLMNLRQLAGVKKKFSSIDSDYGQGPIFSQDRLNTLAVASNQKKVEPSKKKSSLPLRVDMPHNDFDEINSQMNLEDASLKDSKPVSLHQTTPNLTKIEENARLESSTIQEEKRNAANPLNSQESADIHSLDSAMVRNTNVVLTPNYEHTMREGISNPDHQRSQEKEQDSSDKLAQNIISADVKVKKEFEVHNFKNAKAKKQIRGQYFQNGIRGGFYASDKHIVYQKGNPLSLQKNNILTMKGSNAVQIIAQDTGQNQVSQYLSTSNPLLNFGNVSTQNFGYPLLSRQNEKASNLYQDSSSVQFKVLKQIQGVDANRFREEEKARLLLKYQEKKQTREKEMRLNFITSTRSESRIKTAHSVQRSGQQVLESPSTAKAQNLMSERDGTHNAELILIEEEREEKMSAENSQRELEKCGQQQILMSEESESIEGERIQLDQFFKLDPSKRRQSVAQLEDLNQMKELKHIEPFEDEEYFQYGADYESALQNLKYIKSSSAIKQSPFNAGESDKATINEDFSTKVLKQSSLMQQDLRVKLKRPGEIITSKEAIKQGDVLLSAERVKSPMTSDLASKRSSFFKAKAQNQIEQHSLKQQKETVQILIEPSSPQKVNIDIDKVIGQANPSNISLENYSQDLKHDQIATLKSDTTLLHNALKTSNRDKNYLDNQNSFQEHKDANKVPDLSKDKKLSLERVSSRNSRNSNIQNETKEGGEKLLSLQQRSSSSIDKQYLALRVRQFESLNDNGGSVSGRQVMSSHNSRRTSLQSSTFRLVSPKLNKNSSLQNKGGDHLDEKIGVPQLQQEGNRQSPADSQTEDIQKAKIFQSVRKVPQIKFTNIRDALYSSQSGRDTVRSTNDINSRRTLSQQARRISSQTTRSLCKKFFENSQSNNEEGFYDNEINYPLKTERNIKSQGLKAHQDSKNRFSLIQSGNSQSKITKVEQELQGYQAWGFSTDRINFRPNTESGNQRQRLINLKSSQSSRHHNVLKKENQYAKQGRSSLLKPQTAVETSNRVRISSLLNQADPQSALSAVSSQKNFRIQLWSQSEMSDQLRHERIKLTSNVSKSRRNKHFEYYAQLLGDPLNREASQFNLKEPISGINPLHVYLMGERLGIITKNFAFKNKKSQTLNITESQQSSFRKDFPELLWIAQQALIIKTPPESIPSTFFVNSYDVYQSLSTLNFGLHPGDQYFRQLFETIVSNKEYQENDSKQIARCSWLYFVDKSDSSQKEKGYYFNMATQSKKLGEQNQPQALLKVSRKDMVDDNDTVSQKKFKRILTTQQSITRRESLLTVRQSSNNLAEVTNSMGKDREQAVENAERMKGSLTSRTQTAQYQSVLMNLKSKYLSNIQREKANATSPKRQTLKNEIPNSPTKSGDTIQSPISLFQKEKSNQETVSQKSSHQRRVSLSRRKLSQRQMATTSQKPLFPLGSNDFLIQRRLSLEFTMKNKQEQQQKRKDEIINLMVKNSTHSKQQTLQSQQSLTQGQVKFFDDQQSVKADTIVKEIEQVKPIIKILRLPQPKESAFNKPSVLQPTPYQRNLQLKEQLSLQNLALKSFTQHPEVALIPNLKIEEMNLIEKKFDNKKDQAKIFSDNLRKSVAMIRGQTYQSNQYTSRGANSQLHRFNRGVTGKNSSENENIHDFYDGFEDQHQETDTFLQSARPQLQQRLMMNQDVNDVLTNQGDPLGVSHLHNQNKEGDNLSSKVQLEADYFNLDDQELIRGLQQYQYASHQSQKSQQIPRSTVLINKANGIEPTGQQLIGMRRQSTLKQSPNHHISKFVASPSRVHTSPDRDYMEGQSLSNRRQLLSKKSRSSQILVDARASKQAEGFGITMRKTSKISDFQCQTPNYPDEQDFQDDEEQDFQDYDEIE